VTKKYVALARVSSREQQREGFSLDIQEDALRRYAERMGGTIVKLFKIAETATKRDERRAFKELLAYAKKHADELTGLLFYKVDRAARNLFDYVELERLESELGLEFISVSQPTENTPAGRMQRRMLASMASFYTEQQSLDVKEGLARRVKEGWFVGHAPYGYRNVRIDGRGVVEIDPVNAPKVRRIFELFAYHSLTLDMLIERLAAEGIVYRDSTPQFPRSTLHAILHDRAYIGEVEHKGQWYPGKHSPLVDRETWDRVQALLGGQVYRTHELTYGSDLITCQCGHKIVGERKIKRTKAGDRDYNYYRCSKYTSKGHPRIRLTEADLDKQVLALFAKLRIEDAEVRDWVLRVLRERTREEQEATREQRVELHRQLTVIQGQTDQLLNLRLLEEIDADTFAGKSTELRDRAARLKLQAEVLDRGHDENADIAIKAFELSQSLMDKWLTTDYAAKRQILEIVCLNWRLDDVTLIPEMRKPFDVLAEGLLSKESRGDRIRTCDLLNPILFRPVSSDYAALLPLYRS
jgi:DNA invertase Pin-like site-specific DNA recombinase